MHLRCAYMHIKTSHGQAGRWQAGRYFCSICATHVRLGSSTDLNITHCYVQNCPNKWPFSDWSGLWLEGSHGRVGKLDWRWGASEEGWEEGEESGVDGQGRPAPLGLDSSRLGSPVQPWSQAPLVVGAFSWWEEVLGMVTPWSVWDSGSWGTHLQDAWDGLGRVGWLWEFIIQVVLLS